MSLPLVDEILNIETEVLPETSSDTLPAVIEAESTAVATVTPTIDNRLETDFEFAREKMRELINKGHAAIDSAILLAQSGDSPRAYEVVSTAITSLIQANKELVGLHKTRQETLDIHDTPSVDGGGSSPSVNINNAVFVGKASDLLRQIRQIAAG